MSDVTFFGVWVPVEASEKAVVDESQLESGIGCAGDVGLLGQSVQDPLMGPVLAAGTPPSGCPEPVLDPSGRLFGRDSPRCIARTLSRPPFQPGFSAIVEQSSTG